MAGAAEKIQKQFLLITCLILTFAGFRLFAEIPGGTAGEYKDDITQISLQQQQLIVAPGGKSALAVHFTLAKDWHSYADAKTAPGGMNLQVRPKASAYIKFDAPIMPVSQMYHDKSSGQKLRVFSGKFTVYLPFTVDANMSFPGAFAATEYKTLQATEAITLEIRGAVCSNQRCQILNPGTLASQFSVSQSGQSAEAAFTLPEIKTTADKGGFKQYPIAVAMALAILAGLTLNIMPCVWPVLPIIVMRILNQAKRSKPKSIVLGLSFCLGIILFFVALAAINIVLRLGFGTALQWGDHLRIPALVLTMIFILVALAMFMFGLLNFGIPASVSGKTQSGGGISGSIGMGFLAAVLSTPCSFAILAFAFGWAQTQNLLLGTTAIILIGLGMASPYAVLTSLPGLLAKLPRPGRWMELFKQSMGFLLLAIAVKLLEALPFDRAISALYFAAVLAFCLWMWGSWVNYATPAKHKWTIRLLAALIAVVFAVLLLPVPAEKLINWRHYDRDIIAESLAAKRPVLIDFTAEWCLNCKVQHKAVYTRKDIAELIEQKNTLAVEGDTTRLEYPASIDLKQVYNEPGVPVSILLVPGRSEPVKLRGVFIRDKLKKILSSLPDANLADTDERN
ncbi:MAG: thioredoxin family protein [Planctomycetota bacterium]